MSESDPPGWLVRLGRVGYAAKGFIYIVVGFLAITASIGLGGGTTDTRGAIRAIGAMPFGFVALIAVSLGLLGYAGWRVASAITDAERRGSSLKAIALRIGEVFRGLVYGALGASTLKYLIDRDNDTSDKAREMTRWALHFPAGRWVVMGTGAGILGYALYQLYRAIKRKYLRRLDLSPASPRTRMLMEKLGGFGIAARAVVFGMIGFFILRAGWEYDPSKAGGIEKSLDAIRNHSLIFGIIAAGLIAFGVLQIATARYRVMRES
ncbi:MAG TPA: DUF1206 domain-containing protein [Gemmatimonadaceae bacterium]